MHKLTHTQGPFSSTAHALAHAPDGSRIVVVSTRNGRPSTAEQYRVRGGQHYRVATARHRWGMPESIKLTGGVHVVTK